MNVELGHDFLLRFQASQPIFWNYDHALHLYPLPDVLILGDEVDFYKSEFEGCKVFNPGQREREETDLP